jgi:hypothetical protein
MHLEGHRPTAAENVVPVRFVDGSISPRDFEEARSEFGIGAVRHDGHVERDLAPAR